MVKVTVDNRAPYSREFVLPDGRRVRLDPGKNEISQEVLDKLMEVPRFRQLQEAKLPVVVEDGARIEEMAREVMEGELELESIPYVAERVKVVERITDPQVLRELAERSTSVTVNKAIAKQLRKLEAES